MASATRLSAALVVRRTAADPEAAQQGRGAGRDGGDGRGFGAGFGGRQGAGGRSGAQGRRKRGSGLSAADRSPLGKAPDLEAIVARQRLGLPLAGRLREADVTRAWKLSAADHHPDRGGQLDTMQAVNTARDLLLGRGVG